jgi:hypothetical protein
LQQAITEQKQNKTRIKRTISYVAIQARPRTEGYPACLDNEKNPGYNLITNETGLPGGKEEKTHSNRTREHPLWKRKKF